MLLGQLQLRGERPRATERWRWGHRAHVQWQEVREGVLCGVAQGTFHISWLFSPCHKEALLPETEHYCKKWRVTLRTPLEAAC